MITISFMSANYVAREVGYAMHGWGHGDRATNEAFRPLETYPAKLGEVLLDVRELGFDVIDVWGAHLHPGWATDDHVEIARDLLGRHGLRVASYELFVGPEHAERTAEIATALGTTVVAGFVPVELVPMLRERGHPLTERDLPQEMRRAHKLGYASRDKTEAMRQALLHYRAVMERMMGPLDEKRRELRRREMA